MRYTSQPNSRNGTSKFHLSLEHPSPRHSGKSGNSSDLHIYAHKFWVRRSWNPKAEVVIFKIVTEIFVQLWYWGSGPDLEWGINIIIRNGLKYVKCCRQGVDEL